jgi:hypothetical protein
MMPWEDNSRLPPPEPVCRRWHAPDLPGRAIDTKEGYEVMVCACTAPERKLRLGVGHSCDHTRLLATGRFHITGRYEGPEAVDLIRARKAYACLSPSMWPETWCYALSQDWQTRPNVAACDIGTPAGPIRHTALGWVYTLWLSPKASNDRLLELDSLAHPHFRREV